MIYQKYQDRAIYTSREQQKDLDAEFQKELQETYLPDDENLEAPVFSQAWEYGHSNGYSEVEIYYMDLAELVKHAKKLILPSNFKG